MSDSSLNRSQEARYLEHQRSGCGCAFEYDSETGESHLEECSECGSEVEVEADSDYKVQRLYCKEFFRHIEMAELKKDKIKHLITLFHYLQNESAFLRHSPPFCAVITRKLEEFVSDGFPADEAQKMRDYLGGLFE